MNFISCAKWVKKGVAKRNPEKVELTQEELQKIITSTRDEINELRGDKSDNDDVEPMEDEQGASTSNSDNFNFNDYDKDEYDDSLFGIGGIIVNTEEDEYKLKDEDHDSDEEDDIIQPTDNLIAVGHVDGHASILEIFIYNEKDGDLYVHHDILLPTVPLCLEWLSYEPTDSKPGNLIAVGGMSAVIGVWDLDVVDCLEPAYQLGKFSVKKKRNKSHGHKDAVLDIAWNKNFKHILASGSVDKTILLWDLDVGHAATTFTDFNDKIQCLKWSPNDYHSLIAGSSDKTARLFDCRMNEVRYKWEFDEEIEKVNFCPWDSYKIYLGTNGGNIISYDIRNDKEMLWKIKGHEKEITGLEVDNNCPGLLVTCSMDEMVKVWDVNESIILKSQKSFGLCELQCLDLNPDCPYVACIGGTKKNKNFKVINIQHEMLQSPETVVDSMPVVLSEENQNFNKNNEELQVTENAFKSLSIKNKKLKSKKKFGHKNRKS